MCPCKKEKRFLLLYQSSEALEGCYFAENGGKIEKQFCPALRQRALTHLPRNAAVSGEEQNSSHSPANIFSRSHSLKIPTLPQSQNFVSTEEVEWIATAQHTAILQEVLLGLAGSMEKMSI